MPLSSGLSSPLQTLPGLEWPARSSLTFSSSPRGGSRPVPALVPILVPILVLPEASELSPSSPVLAPFPPPRRG